MLNVDPLLLANYGIIQPVPDDDPDGIVVNLDDATPQDLRDIHEFACSILEERTLANENLTS